ncbi:MAG: Dabb family protein [Sporolactobacillus sp.]
MIEHIVLFKFSKQTSIEQKVEGARRLQHLSAELPDILDIQAGQNVTDRGKGYSMALTARFPSKEALDFYTPSPQHQAVVSYLKAIGLEDSLAIDFEF